MGVQSHGGGQSTGISDLLAIGFGTTVAMWAAGYVGHMPLADVPPPVFVGLMLVCLAGGGWVAGGRTPRGIVGGLGVGLIAAVLNLLVLGSVLAEPETQRLVPQVWLWVPGYFVLCLAITAVGAAAGSVFRKPEGTDANWPAVFAWVSAMATLLLIAIGGLVTGFRAGMAVDDWPRTFGSNMFLYPLAKMTGGVFYEHAHRLVGSLVGLTTLALAVLLLVLCILRRCPVGATALAWAVGACVALQGVMGGLRVTDNSPHLAAVHGFFAHAILAGMVGVAVLLARRPQAGDCPDFRRLSDGTDPASAAAAGENGTVPFTAAPNGADCFFATLLVLAVLAQTLLGTLVRQMDVGLLVHLGVAMLVAVLAMLVGVRLWGLYPHIGVFARGGVALMGVVVLQVVLGGVSLVFRTPPAVNSPTARQLIEQPDALRPAVHALLTTSHQTTAAVLLALATLLAFWTWRLVVFQWAVAEMEELPANS